MGLKKSHHTVETRSCVLLRIKVIKRVKVKRNVVANKRRKRSFRPCGSMSSSDGCSCNTAELARSRNEPRTDWGGYSKLKTSGKSYILYGQKTRETSRMKPAIIFFFPIGALSSTRTMYVFFNESFYAFSRTFAYQARNCLIIIFIMQNRIL